MASNHLRSEMGRWDNWSKWLLLMPTWSSFSILPQGQVMPFWGPLGFISGQTPFPQAADPHLSCAKGSREETSALPLLFLLGFWERSSSAVLKAEQLWQGRDGARQITLPFAPGRREGGNHEVWPHQTNLLWLVFPQAITLTATI